LLFLLEILICIDQIELRIFSHCLLTDPAGFGFIALVTLFYTQMHLFEFLIMNQWTIMLLVLSNKCWSFWHCCQGWKNNNHMHATGVADETSFLVGHFGEKSPPPFLLLYRVLWILNVLAMDPFFSSTHQATWRA